MKLILQLILLSSLAIPLSSQNIICDDEMVITWWFKEDSIYFRVTTPSLGWQAIGFNKSKEIAGTYLLLGRVMDLEVEGVEHYVHSAGDHRPIKTLNDAAGLNVKSSKIDKNEVELIYCLPIKSQDPLRPALPKGKSIYLHYAYSLSNDFKHHSIFRSKAKIIL